MKNQVRPQQQRFTFSQNQQPTPTRSRQSHSADQQFRRVQHILKNLNLNKHLPTRNLQQVNQKIYKHFQLLRPQNAALSRFIQKQEIDAQIKNNFLETQTVLVKNYECNRSYEEIKPWFQGIPYQEIELKTALQDAQHKLDRFKASDKQRLRLLEKKLKIRVKRELQQETERIVGYRPNATSKPKRDDNDIQRRLSVSECANRRLSNIDTSHRQQLRGATVDFGQIRKKNVERLVDEEEEEQEQDQFNLAQTDQIHNYVEKQIEKSEGQNSSANRYLQKNKVSSRMQNPFHYNKLLFETKQKKIQQYKYQAKLNSQVQERALWKQLNYKNYGL